MEMRQRSGRSRATRSTIVGRAVHRLERADAERARRVDARRSARSSSSSDARGARSRPYDPRCTPVSATSLKPAAATRSTSRTSVVDRQAARRAARRRDDAVRARLLAAGLHAERERGAARDARLDGGAARAVAIEALRRSNSPMTLARGRPCTARRAARSRAARTCLEPGRRRACRRCARRGRRRQRRDLVFAPRRVAAGGHDLARRDSRARCAGSSAARPDRPSPSPSRC